MSKSLDELSRNLAGGMSRRKAFWSFLTGLGVAAVFTGRKASAAPPRNVCVEFCNAQAEVFKDLCIAASLTCKPGYCAEISLINFNGSRSVNFNGGPFVCVPVNVP